MFSALTQQILKQASITAWPVTTNSVGAVIDDAAILSDSLYDAAILANKSKEHERQVTRICREQLSHHMKWNRAKIGIGLTFIMTALSICLPGLIPFAIASMSLLAGAYFSIGCANETIELFKATQKGLTKKPQEHQHHSVPMTDEEIIAQVVNEGKRKDFTLTIELMLVALSTAFASPGFASLLQTTSLLAWPMSALMTPMLLAAPMLAAGVATWAVVRAATYRVTKWSLKAKEEHQRALSLTLGWIGNSMLTNITGGMMLHGLTNLLPVAASSFITNMIPLIGASIGLSPFISGIAATLLVGAMVGFTGLFFRKATQSWGPEKPEKSPIAQDLRTTHPSP